MECDFGVECDGGVGYDNILLWSAMVKWSGCIVRSKGVTQNQTMVLCRFMLVTPLIELIEEHNVG